MTYVIYLVSSTGRKQYLVDLPSDEKPLSGIGYQSMNDGSVPDTAGTCPTEGDAKRLCDWLLTASYGPPTEHFYEKAPEGAQP